MDASAKVGLPECNIGLLPGAQGTQRLPRLIGSEHALQLMTTGSHVGAEQALKLGVVDKVVTVDRKNKKVSASEQLLAAAIAFAETKIGTKNEDLPRVSTRDPPSPANWASWEKRMKRKRPGEPAPLAIIRCVKAACDGPTFADGVEVEQSEFFPLIVSPESKALRHVRLI